MSNSVQRKIFLIGGPANGQEVVIKGEATIFRVAQIPPIKLRLCRDTCSPARTPDLQYFNYKQSPEDPCLFIYS